MKKFQIINDDYEGHVDICRHACRGIVIKDGKILLSYESNEDKYIIQKKNKSNMVLLELRFC